MKLGKILGIGIPVVLALALVVSAFSTVRAEVRLRNSAVAHGDVNKAHFDKMWKILKTQAGVLDKYKEDFKDIWVPLIEGRYKQGNGKMMSWIQERNPNFDSGMYKTLMTSVEAQRTSFFEAQKKLIDIKREHDDLRKLPPQSMWLSWFGDNSELNITVITSATTKETFSTGEENDVDLFK